MNAGKTMKKSTDSAVPAFWNHRYSTGETPWVLHKIPATLSSFLKRTRTRGRVLIPGAEVIADLKVSDSVPMFADMERWQES